LVFFSKVVRGAGLCWLVATFEVDFLLFEEEPDDEGLVERLLAPLDEPVLTLVGIVGDSATLCERQNCECTVV
jgi:hypothetical protein